MRQFGDTLVWIAMILVVAAVVYYTPQIADYVSATESQSIHRNVAWYAMHHGEEAESEAP
jgi:hypothetical protein